MVRFGFSISQVIKSSFFFKKAQYRNKQIGECFGFKHWEAIPTTRKNVCALERSAIAERICDHCQNSNEDDSPKVSSNPEKLRYKESILTARGLVVII